MTEEQSCDNCYNILKKYGLECPKYCDYETAKIALRKLYLKHHPDKGGDPEIFKEIRECGTMVVNDKCTDTYNIRTKCDIMTQKLRKTYTVKPTCIKYRSPKNKDTKLSDCSTGSYKRKGFTVQEKCKIFSSEEKKAADDYTAKQQQKKDKQEFKLDNLNRRLNHKEESWRNSCLYKVIHVYNKPFPPKSDFYLLNIKNSNYEYAYEDYIRKGYYTILHKASIKRQKEFEQEIKEEEIGYKKSNRKSPKSHTKISRKSRSKKSPKKSPKKSRSKISRKTPTKKSRSKKSPKKSRSKISRKTPTKKSKRKI